MGRSRCVRAERLDEHLDEQEKDREFQMSACSVRPVAEPHLQKGRAVKVMAEIMCAFNLHRLRPVEA